MSQKITFRFPECWEDDMRMNALFAPFRPKSINPQYYSKKLEFWQVLIYNFCKSKIGCPVFRKQDLELAFKRKEEVPHCLDIIIDDMICQKYVQEQSEYFMRSTGTWTSWIFCTLLKNPLKWTYNRMIAYSNQGTYQFIHCDLLKQLSNDLLFILRKHSGKVFSLDDLKQEIKDEIYLNEFGLKICLYNLNVQKFIYLDYDVSGYEINVHLIKIPSTHEPVNKLTDIDRNFQQLKDTRKYLIREMDNIELQLTEYDNLARKNVKLNNTKLAKVYLRTKYYLQNRREKKIGILINLETLIAQIEDAHANGIVLSAFKVGSETLQSLNSKLTIENIDEIMSTVEDVQHNHAEIEDCIANLNMAEIEDTNLDKELEELLLSENEISQNIQLENVVNQQYEKNIIDHLYYLKVESDVPSKKSTAIKD